MASRSRTLGRLGVFARWEVLLALVLIGVIWLGASLSPVFLSTRNFANLIQAVVEVGIMALPMALIIIAGEIDLSVEGMVGLSASVLGFMWAAGFGMEAAIPAALVVGAVGGLLNGVLVTVVALPSLVVTLGTLALFRGLALVVLGPQGISGFPDWFSAFGFGAIPGLPIPYPFLIFVVLAIVLGYVLHATWIGRQLYAVGKNVEAARFSGVRVDRLKLALFVLSGTIAAVAGVVIAARLSSARADTGEGMTLTVITIVLLGGVDIFGGRGTILGVVLAFFTLAVLGNALRLANVPSEVQSIVIGALLIISVVIPTLARQCQSAFDHALQSRRHAGGAGRTRRDGQSMSTGGVTLARPHLRRFATLLAASAIVVAACGTSTTSNAPEPASEAPASQAPGSAAASAPAAGDLSVTFIPKQVNNPYFDAAATGAERAAGELGGTFTQIGPSAATEPQVPYIQDATTQGVSAIGISVNDPDAVVPALTAARDAGIKVVGYDSSPAVGAYDVFVNQVDFSGVGVLLADWACELAPDCTGEIAVLSAAATAANQNEWIALMEQTLTEPKYAGLTLVDTVYGDDDPTTSTTQANALLANHPNLKVIVAPTTVGILAAAQVVSQAGKSDAVKVTGLGFPNDMREYVKDGTSPVFGLWSVPDLGYLTYQIAAKLVAGEITGAEGETFSVAGLNGDQPYTIGPDSVVVLGPAFRFDETNIDEFDF